MRLIGLPVLGGELLNEVIREQRDVLLPLPEGRDADREHRASR